MEHSNTSVDFNRLFDILTYQQIKYPQKKALNYFQAGSWHAFTIDEIQKRADVLSIWLMEQGYRRGECVALLPRMGSPLWMIVDIACQQLGLILVPIHPTSSLEEMEFILKETEAPLCIAIDEGLYFKVLSLKEKLNSIRQAYHLDKKASGYLTAIEGKGQDKNSLKALVDQKAAIKPEDTLAIMYTSGTSGEPKGVVLSHQNVVSNIKSILTLLPLQAGERVLSFLPFSHIFERTSCFAFMAFGLQIYFAQSLDTLNHDFKTVKPILCTTVPRTMEKMYDILQQRSLDGNIFKRKLITWAIEVGKRYKTRRSIIAFYRFKLFFARLLVLNVWRRKLGGRIRYMVVGAAALRPEIGRLFSAGGVLTLSGYGMTEASPYISVNRTEPGLNRFGTVGIPVPGVNVRIDEPNENAEGEIIVKGPNVMRGYFKRPDLTDEVLTKDGWLRTGDVGKMVNKHFLVITDRKKDIFKTSTGKYIAPQVLENHFISSAFILQCLILGFNKPYVTALLVPNFEILQTWCAEQNIHWTAPQYMVHNIKVVKKIQEEVDRLNEQLQGYERVKKFILSEGEWTVEGKELTPSFKLKRNQLAEQYKSIINKMYN